MLREMHVSGAWVVLGCPCSPVKIFVCRVPESAGSGRLLCPAQPLIYPWPGEGRAPGSSVCPAKCPAGESTGTGAAGSACVWQSELVIWNPFPVELVLQQGLSPGSNMFCQHRSLSVPEGFLLMTRNFVTCHLGRWAWRGRRTWKGGQGCVSSSLLFSPAACPERCPRVHLLVSGIHGAGSDGQPCGAGGFPEGILGPTREPTAAAVPRGGSHQRQGRPAPLQVREWELPQQGSRNSCPRVAGNGDKSLR